METLIHADIFFFVATIGCIVVLALIAIVLVRLIRLFASLERITRRMEKKIDEVGDVTKEFVDELKHSRIFTWLFGTRHK